jgi:hypothetical protein
LTAPDITPRVRARWSQRVLGQVASQHAGLRAQLPPTAARALERIEQTSPLDWVLLVDHVAMLDALLQTLGPESFARLYRRSASGAARSSLFRSLVESTFELFGNASLLRGFPVGWKLIYQNAGEPRVSREHDATRIEISRLHACQRTSAAYALSMQLAVEGFSDAVGRPITITTDDSRQRDGVLILVVRVKDR